MTTIAWDGKTLAADRMVTDGTFKGTKTKIRRTGIGLLGASGDARYSSTAMDWLLEGGVGPFPKHPTDDEAVYLIHITLKGEIDVYFNCPEPVRMESPFYALGSGRDFALAAMYLGHDAVKAVAVAKELDANTGKGTDVLHLEQI